jgi:site-specific DNA recombinase
MKAVGYYRYSSDNKAQRDNSENRQSHFVKDLIAKKGWLLVEEVADRAVSGAETKPAAAELRRKIEHKEIKVDVLVVDEQSRLTRDRVTDIGIEWGWLEKANVKVCFVNGRSAGQLLTYDEFSRDLVALIEGSSNHEYLRKLSKAVTGGMKTKFMDGKCGWFGKTPLGYDLIRQPLETPSSYLVANKDLVHVKEIFKFVLNGGTIRGAAEILMKTERYQTRWEKGDRRDPNSTSVKNLLRNPIYTGKRAFGARRGKKTKFSPINEGNPHWTKENPLTLTDYVIDYDPPGFRKAIEFSDWKRIQETLDSNKAIGKRGVKIEHRYAGLLRCGNCGSRMVAETYTDKRSGKKIFSFTCNASRQRGPKCREEEPYRKSIREEEVDAMLVAFTAENIMSTRTHLEFMESIYNKIQEESEASEKTNKRAEVEQQQERVDKLTSRAGDMDSDSFWDAVQKQVRILDAMKEELQEEEEAGDLDLLQICRESAENCRGQEGHGNYLAYVYEAVERLVAEFDGKRTDTKKFWKRVVEEARGIKDEFIGDGGGSYTYGGVLQDQKGLIPEDKFMMKKINNLGTAEECLKFWRDRLLEEIWIGFEKGTSRGKISQVPVDLSITALLRPSGRRDTRLLFKSDQIQVMTLERGEFSLYH